MAITEYRFAFEVWGDYAMFASPASKIGGELRSYPVPTYSALCGICEKIYWKPTIRYRIRRVRIMNRVNFECVSKRLIVYNSNNSNPVFPMYLRNVRYRVIATMEFNENLPELAEDRNMGKHINILERSLEAGGRMPIYLGTSECPGFVKPITIEEFSAGEGFYDNETDDIGTMLLTLVYPNRGWDDATRTHLSVTYWRPKMINGNINFIQPEECKDIRYIRPMEIKRIPPKEVQNG